MLKKALLIVILAASLLLSACAGNWVFIPETPYPYDLHREAQTQTYINYQLHYQGPQGPQNLQDPQRRQSPTRY